jgi:hypothetical protein
MAVGNSTLTQSHSTIRATWKFECWISSSRSRHSFAHTMLWAQSATPTLPDDPCCWIPQEVAAGVLGHLAPTSSAHFRMGFVMHRSQTSQPRTRPRGGSSAPHGTPLSDAFASAGSSSSHRTNFAGLVHLYTPACHLSRQSPRSIGARLVAPSQPSSLHPSA